MTIKLDTDQQVTPTPLDGGEYIVATFLNGGTASLDVQLQGSTNWAPLGALTAEPQTVKLPRACKLRLNKTGAAVVEVSG